MCEIAHASGDVGVMPEDNLHATSGAAIHLVFGTGPVIGLGLAYFSRLMFLPSQWDNKLVLLDLPFKFEF